MTRLIRALIVALSLASLAGCSGSVAPPAASPTSLVVSTGASSATTVAATTPSAEPTQPPPTPPEDHPRARAVSVDHGPRSEKLVALTFDADMTSGMLAQLRSGEVDSWYNEPVIRELRKTRTPATLFITGLWARTYPHEVRDFARDPLFEIASHSWDHAAWTDDCYGLPSVQTSAQKRAEVRKTEAELEQLTGETPFYFRFPGGCGTMADLRIVAREGEQAVGWDVVSGDAFGTDPDAVAQATIDHVKPGSIVVMHLHGGANAPTTAPALKQIIPALTRAGYRFVTLSDLLEGPEGR